MSHGEKGTKNGMGIRGVDILYFIEKLNFSNYNLSTEQLLCVVKLFRIVIL